MIDTLIHWLRTIFILVAVVLFGWWLINHAAEAGSFIVTVVSAIVTFVETVFYGVLSLF